MNVLSYKGHPMKVVRPMSFDGVSIEDGVPIAVDGLPEEHRVICGITHDNGTESLHECADLQEMQAVVQHASTQRGNLEVNWYMAPSADCLQELYVRNQPSTPTFTPPWLSTPLR